jgi:CMP/dCMP kinase
MLADRIGYRYLDTGAMYRAVAYAYHRANSRKDIGRFLETLDLRFSFDDGVSVFLDGDDISGHIRSSEISLAASLFSQDPAVRAYCTNLQRKLGEAGGVVVEGRDTGSVVFPDAEKKFYLDADVAERARRRHGETTSKTEKQESLARIQADMEKRDRDDSGRLLAPLMKPEGAVYIDTTNKSIDEVVSALLETIEGNG